MTRYCKEPRGPTISVNSWGVFRTRQTYGPRVRQIVTNQVRYRRGGTEWAVPYATRQTRHVVRRQVRQDVCFPLWFQLHRQTYVPRPDFLPFWTMLTRWDTDAWLATLPPI